jgi:hypothetical protein
VSFPANLAYRQIEPTPLAGITSLQMLENPYSNRKLSPLSRLLTRQDESEDHITNLMGVAQALISIFADNDDRMRWVVFQPH